MSVNPHFGEWMDPGVVVSNTDSWERRQSNLAKIFQLALKPPCSDGLGQFGLNASLKLEPIDRLYPTESHRSWCPLPRVYKACFQSGESNLEANGSEFFGHTLNHPQIVILTTGTSYQCCGGW